MQAPSLRVRVAVVAALAGLALYYYLVEVVYMPSLDEFRLNLADNRVVRLLDSPAEGAVVYPTLFAIVAYFALGWQWLAGRGVSRRMRIAVGIAVTLLALRWAFREAVDLNLLCQYKESELAELCDTTAGLVKDIGEAVGGDVQDIVWLSNGSLVGLMRDQQPNFMIGNDHDFDYCMRRGLGPVIGERIRQRGYYFAEWISNFKHKIRVYPNGSRVNAGHSGSLSIDIEECDVESPVLWRRGCNGHMMPYPANFELALSRNFGNGWRVPRDENHKGACLLYRMFA